MLGMRGEDMIRVLTSWKNILVASSICFIVASILAPSEPVDEPLGYLMMWIVMGIGIFLLIIKLVLVILCHVKR